MAIEGECLTVGWACKYFIQGAKIIMATDHKPLIGLYKKENLDENERRLQRLRRTWENFDIEMIYITGKENTEADTLSRNPTKEKEELKFNSVSEVLANNPVETECPFNKMHSKYARINRSQVLRQGVRKTIQQLYNIENEEEADIELLRVARETSKDEYLKKIISLINANDREKASWMRK